MRRILLGTLAAVTAAISFNGCYAHEDYRERPHHVVYYDNYGHEYRHARWRDQDVWQREDGRWYTRHNNDWVIQADVDIH